MDCWRRTVSLLLPCRAAPVVQHCNLTLSCTCKRIGFHPGLVQLSMRSVLHTLWFNKYSKLSVEMCWTWTFSITGGYDFESCHILTAQFPKIPLKYPPFTFLVLQEASVPKYCTHFSIHAACQWLVSYMNHELQCSFGFAHSSLSMFLLDRNFPLLSGTCDLLSWYIASIQDGNVYRWQFLGSEQHGFF